MTMIQYYTKHDGRVYSIYYIRARLKWDTPYNYIRVFICIYPLSLDEDNAWRVAMEGWLDGLMDWCRQDEMEPVEPVEL